MALLANFVLVPLLAYVIKIVIPVSAAILVSVQNFGGTNTLSFVLVAASLLLLILLPTAQRSGCASEGVWDARAANRKQQMRLRHGGRIQQF